MPKTAAREGRRVEGGREEPLSQLWTVVSVALSWVCAVKGLRPCASNQEAIKGAKVSFGIRMKK